MYLEGWAYIKEKNGACCKTDSETSPSRHQTKNQTDKEGTYICARSWTGIVIFFLDLRLPLAFS